MVVIRVAADVVARLALCGTTLYTDRARLMDRRRLRAAQILEFNEVDLGVGAMRVDGVSTCSVGILRANDDVAGQVGEVGKEPLAVDNRRDDAAGVAGAKMIVLERRRERHSQAVRRDAVNDSPLRLQRKVRVELPHPLDVSRVWQEDLVARAPAAHRRLQVNDEVAGPRFHSHAHERRSLHRAMHADDASGGEEARAPLVGIERGIERAIRDDDFSPHAGVDRRISRSHFQRATRLDQKDADRQLRVPIVEEAQPAAVLDAHDVGDTAVAVERHVIPNLNDIAAHRNASRSPGRRVGPQAGDGADLRGAKRRRTEIGDMSARSMEAALRLDGAGKRCCEREKARE